MYNENTGGKKIYLLFKFRVFFLRMDQFETDVEYPSYDQGKEEAESCQVCVSLCAVRYLVLIYVRGMGLTRISSRPCWIQYEHQAFVLNFERGLTRL